MSTDTTTGLARGILDSVSDDTLVLALPHSDYKVHLTPAVPAARSPSRGEAD